MSAILTKSGGIQGLPVTGLAGAKLGPARELFVDLAAGRIEFLIVEEASLLGSSGKYHPVPWSAVRYDPVAVGFQIEVAKDDFKTSPSYDREQLASASYGWDEQSTRYFATPRVA